MICEPRSKSVRITREMIEAGCVAFARRSIDLDGVIETAPDQVPAVLRDVFRAMASLASGRTLRATKRD